MKRSHQEMKLSGQPLGKPSPLAYTPDQDHRWYSFSIVNSTDAKTPLPAQIFENRQLPLLSSPGDYRAALVQFRLPTQDIPLMIWPNNSFAHGSVPDTSIVFQGDILSGSAVITNITGTAFAQAQEGMSIFGYGIQPGSFIQTIGPGNQLTMSAQAVKTLAQSYVRTVGSPYVVSLTINGIIGSPFTQPVNYFNPIVYPPGVVPTSPYDLPVTSIQNFIDGINRALFTLWNRAINATLPPSPFTLTGFQPVMDYDPRTQLISLNVPARYKSQFQLAFKIDSAQPGMSITFNEPLAEQFFGQSFPFYQQVSTFQPEQSSFVESSYTFNFGFSGESSGNSNNFVQTQTAAVLSMTSGSSLITLLNPNDAFLIFKGEQVSGPGIPDGSIVIATSTGAGTMTISQSATQTFAPSALNPYYPNITITRQYMQLTQEYITVGTWWQIAKILVTSTQIPVTQNDIASIVGESSTQSAQNSADIGQSQSFVFNGQTVLGQNTVTGISPSMFVGPNPKLLVGQVITAPGIVPPLSSIISIPNNNSVVIDKKALSSTGVSGTGFSTTIQSDNIDTQSVGLGIGALAPILFSFSPLSTEGAIQRNYQQNATGEPYRQVSLVGSVPLYSVDLQFYWTDRQGGLYPLLIGPGDYLDGDILFVHKLAPTL
jgi:hypothetical protein